MRPIRLLPCLLVLAATAGSLSAQRRAPERAVREFAAGTPHAVTLVTVDSGRKGPVILVVGALAPGEPSAWRAARQISGWTPTKGAIHTLLREAPADGDAAGYPEGDGARPTGDFAKRAWPLIEDLEPDVLIELREADGIANRDDEALGNALAIAGPSRAAKLADAALELVHAAERMGDRRFVVRPAEAEGGLTRAQADALGGVGLAVFTTRDSQSTALRTRFQRLVVHAVLDRLGVVEHGPHTLVGLAADDDDVRVGVYVSSGVSGDGPERLEALLTSEHDFVLRRFSSTDAGTADLLDQFDVIVFPGGDAGQQAAAIRDDGRGQVIGYVRDGGGYAGFGAGAALAAVGDGRLGILDVVVDSPKLPTGAVEVAWARAGTALLRQRGAFEAPFDAGLRFAAADDDALPDAEVLAVYRRDPHGADSAEGLLIGTPAIVRGDFGDGAAIGIGPRVEKGPELGDTTRALIRSVARERDAKPRRRGR